MTSAMDVGGFEAREVVARAARVRYWVGGAGEPLALVHGLAGTSSNWIELLPDLLGRHRVVAIDLPGHGRSSPLARGSSLGDFADAVAAVLEHEGAVPALVAGHSFGGHVSLRLAQRWPELVRALLLVAPAGIATRTRARQVAVALAGVVRPGRLAAPLRGRYAASVWYRRAVFRPWFVADAAALTPRATTALLEGMPLHLDTRTAGRAMLADDPRVELEQVRCPTLVLWGARDPQLPVDDAFEYARRLRGRLRLVADCGHLVPVERPRACLDALEDLVALSN